MLLLRRTWHVVSILMLVLAVDPSLDAQPGPTPGNRTNAQRGNENQAAAQPPINITVTTPQPSTEDAKREEDRRNREVAADEDIRDFTRALTMLTIVQAFITFVALMFTIRAANAAKRSADIATEALHITERADVVIDRINAESIGGELLHDTTVEVCFKNRGRTRATNVTFEGTLGIPGGTMLPKEVAPPVVVASGDEVPFRFKRQLSTYIPASALAGINAGKHILRITGRLHYDDVFKQPHTIDFEGVWNRERTVFEVTKHVNE